MKPNCSAILRLKARSATLASRLTMRLPLPSKLTSDWLGQSRLALPAFVREHAEGMERDDIAHGRVLER
jgi:hypothetical protein